MFYKILPLIKYFILTRCYNALLYWNSIFLIHRLVKNGLQLFPRHLSYKELPRYPKVHQCTQKHQSTDRFCIKTELSRRNFRRATSTRTTISEKWGGRCSLICLVLSRPALKNKMHFADATRERVKNSTEKTASRSLTRGRL